MISRFYVPNPCNTIKSACAKSIDIRWDIPSERTLRRYARGGGYAFNDKSVQPALFDGEPFSDGLLYALSQWFDAPPESLVELTLDRPKSIERKILDYFHMGMGPMVDRLIGNLKLREEAFLQNEKDIEKAAEITLCDIDVSHLETSERTLTDAERIAESIRIGGLESLEYFCDQLYELWKANRMTTIFVVTPTRNKVGVASVVPLKGKPYEEIKRGQMSPYDVTAKDIELKSNNQLILIGALRRDNKNRTSLTDQSRHLAITIFIQLALMTPPKLDRLRILSFSGSPENDERLQRSGFDRYDTCIPYANQPLFEIKKGNTAFNHATRLLHHIQASNR